jgi:hypothetical protein
MRVKVMTIPGLLNTDCEVVYDVERVICTPATDDMSVVAPGTLVLNANSVAWYQTMPDPEDPHPQSKAEVGDVNEAVQKFVDAADLLLETWKTGRPVTDGKRYAFDITGALPNYERARAELAEHGYPMLALETREPAP